MSISSSEVVTTTENGRTKRGLFQAESSPVISTGNSRIIFLSSEYPVSVKKGFFRNIFELRK